MTHKTMLILLAAIALSACRADEVEVRISIDDIKAALAGNEVEVPFHAKFNEFGNLKDDEKQSIQRIEEVAKRYMQIEDFELSSGNSQYSIDIDGNLRVTTGKPKDGAYFILVRPSSEFNGYAEVSIELGPEFHALHEEVGDVNLMLTPEEYHPTKFKLAAKGQKVIAPAVEIDGQTYRFFAGSVSKKININYSGGPYERIGAGFLISTD